MTQELVTAGAILGALVTLVTFWMNLSSRITTSEIKAHAAELVALQATAKFEELTEKVAEYRVAMEVKIAIIKTLAEANTASLTAAELRVAKGLESIGDRLDYFNERIDKFLVERKD